MAAKDHDDFGVLMYRYSPLYMQSSHEYPAQLTSCRCVTDESNSGENDRTGNGDHRDGSTIPIERICPQKLTNYMYG